MESRDAELKRLGDSLRRHRVNRDFSQAEVAAELDMDIRTVQRAEAGEVNLPYTTLCKYYRLLRCPAAELFPQW